MFSSDSCCSVSRRSYQDVTYFHVSCRDGVEKTSLGHFSLLDLRPIDSNRLLTAGSKKFQNRFEAPHQEHAGDSQTCI